MKYCINEQNPCDKIKSLTDPHPFSKNMNQFKQCPITCDKEPQAFKAKPCGNQSKVSLHEVSNVPLHFNIHDFSHVHLHIVI